MFAFVLLLIMFTWPFQLAWPTTPTIQVKQSSSNITYERSHLF